MHSFTSVNDTLLEGNKGQRDTRNKGHKEQHQQTERQHQHQPTNTT